MEIDGKGLFCRLPASKSGNITVGKWRVLGNKKRDRAQPLKILHVDFESVSRVNRGEINRHIE